MTVETRALDRGAGGRAARKRVSPARAAGAVALAAWAALFWFLLISGRTLLYLSTRTDWVVPVGAILLTIAAVGRLATLRTDDPAPVTRREALALGFIALPVVVVLALPPASLGSFAAARRSSLVGAGFAGGDGDIGTGEVTLVDVASGLRSNAAMRALVDRAGSDVSFVGFVARDQGMPADEFLLTRFLVSCCAADALSVQVRVVGAAPGKLSTDEWVRVDGKMYPLGGEVIVDAATVEKVARPKQPYLSP